MFLACATFLVFSFLWGPKEGRCPLEGKTFLPNGKPPVEVRVLL